jgi:hypothetical protein
MKLGFLSPDGKLYECHSYDHLDTAMKICKSFENPVYELRTNLDCEDYLMDIGYVCLRARTVNFSSFCSKKYSQHFNAKFCINFLTNSQRAYLKELFKNDAWFNVDQMDSADDILKYDELLRSTELGVGEVLNPMNKREDV